MKYDYCPYLRDYGGTPYAINVEQMAMQNRNFRTAIWTGEYLQMTLMCIPPGGEIGLEIHPDTDQLICIESGNAVVRMGKIKERPDFRQNLCAGDAVFVPAGTWHNIVNAGESSFRAVSVYAPPHHPKGTVHRTKEEAERTEGY